MLGVVQRLADRQIGEAEGRHLPQSLEEQHLEDGENFWPSPKDIATVWFLIQYAKEHT